MANYFDFVLAKEPGKDDLKLFMAPRWEGLEPGAEVVAETPEGERLFVVVASATINGEETKQIDLIMKATRTKEDGVGRVLSKVVYSPIDNDEEA